LALGLVLVLLGVVSIKAATFTVVNTNDSGLGSLRQAILDANATEENDTVAFNIPGAGEVFTIQPLSALPAITRPIQIDGYTQPGSSPNTKEIGSDAVLKIELDGSRAPPETDGLTLDAGNSVVRGLIIGRFSRFGIRIGGLARVGGNSIIGNHIGCDRVGGVSRANGNNGIAIYDSDGNGIGGANPADRNLISGNAGSGVEVNNSIGGHVKGNYVGVAASGDRPLANSRGGISIWRSAKVAIGGNALGEGNVVAGNGQRGISLVGIEASWNTIQGNRVGVSHSGTVAVGNIGGGVVIENARSNIVGSLDDFGRNIISGNRDFGLLIGGEFAEANQVIGNRIGTDATGRLAITNFGVGVYLIECSRNWIGGTEPGAMNLVSGNHSEGIALGGSRCVGNVIQGNFVGTDIAGRSSIANFYNGINIGGARSNLLGGSIVGAGNLISGNRGAGVHSFDNNTLGNVILGNLIGVDVTALGPLGNGWAGIALEGAASTQIGGLEPGQANVVAFNSDAGIGVLSRSNNVIRGNRIFRNGGPGIDLGLNGDSDNDATDFDSGANLLQNFPVLTNAVLQAGEVAVRGRLRSRPNGTYLIDFYMNPPWVSASSGYEYLGTVSVISDATGRSQFEASFQRGISAGYSITSTATDAAGNTSEFSQPVAVTVPEGSGPRLVVAPVSTDVILGESAVLRALGEGLPPLTYQWFREGQEIGGATEPRLTVTPSSLEDYGQFSVRVSNVQGSVESMAVRLRVLPGWARWEESEGGNGHFYRLTQLPCEAPIAESEAVLYGGHLVTVDSSAEQAFLNRAFLNGPMAGAPLWIGLSDSRIEGRWEWRGGATATYRNWSPGQPQGGESEDYVAMNWGVAEGRNDPLGSWHDVPTAGTSLNNDRTDGPYYGILETAEDPSQAPTITVQPAGANLVTGSDFRLTVEALGDGPFTYQWRWNSAVLTNQVAAELVLTNVAARDAGLYSVVVRNAKAATVSRLTEVNVWAKWETNGHYYGLTAPRGNWPQTEETAAAKGGHLVTVNSADEQTWLVEQFIRPAILRRTFWIGMTDRQEEGVWTWVSGEPVTYTGWDTGEPNNFGGNEDYSLINFIRARDGGFREGGWADEKRVADTVTANIRARGPYQGIIETLVRPPLALELVRPPESRDVFAGQDVEFRIEAQGPGSLAYQWQRDGADLAGEVGSVLSRTSVRGSDAGDYRVVVSAGAVTLPSRVARLQVLEPPTITVQPVSVSTNAGVRVTLSVSATGGGTLAYQWSKGGVPLVDGERLMGATTATLAIEPALIPDSGEYRVRVSNEAGGVDSESAVLSVAVEPPRIVREPADASASEGEPVRLEVGAMGSGLLYRWQREGVDVAGANGATLDIPRLEESFTGGYLVVVSNDGGAVTSRVARVTLKRCVGLPPGMFAWWTGEDHGTDVIRGRVAAPGGGMEYGEGRVGKAFRFDGLDARLEIAQDPALFPGTNSMAVAAWIRTTSAVAYGPIFSKYEAGGEGGEGESLFTFAVREGRLEGRIRDTDAGGPDASSDQRIVGTALVADGRYHHVVFQREVETGRLSLWVDGQLDAEEPLHPSMRGAIQDDDGAADPFLIGAEYAFQSTTFSGVFRGEIDEVMVAKRSMTAEEIAGIHGAGGSGVCPPPIVVIESPQSQRVALGSRLELGVVVRGTRPLTYQWRLNGQDVEGATNAVLVLPSVVLSDGGVYAVLISDGENAEESSPAVVDVELETLALVDRFGDRLVIVASSGAGRTNNLAATVEAAAGEPRHAGKRGGRSLWMTWRPGQTGVATFRTAGSNFDTLLAVYEGVALGSLVEVASDEDSGGFLTSVVRFNAVAGREYQIAVDGFAGASGTVVLSWSLAVEAPVLPEIVLQPAARVGIVGDPVVLTVVATPSGVSYQWFRNGVSLVGRTTQALVFEAIQAADAGTYKVRVRAPNGATVDSDDAVVDVVDRVIGPTSLSADKVDDLFSADELVGGGASPGLHAVGAGTVLMVGTGLGGSQWTDTRRSSRSLEDPRVCDMATTATRWFRLRFELPASNTKALELNSEGSEIPAMIAVFTNRAALTLVGCDVAVPPAKTAAKVSWVPQRGVDYLVLVDGVRGARGRIQLNRVLEPEANPLQPTEYGLRAGRMVIRMFPIPGIYDWQVGPGLESMQTLFRTNLTKGEFGYEDPEPASAPSRIFQLKAVGGGAQPFGATKF